MATKDPLPSGTVTLLFTDIEGSTEHWERQRAAMADALRRHDALLRTAIESRGGHVFKTMGDQFCASFSRAQDALESAADAQRALAAEDWSPVGGLAVRMALHSGATDERDGDYFGPAVNRVARLLAVAHGGQVVASSTTALLVRGMMPEDMELRDLGEHRLKDLIDRERVWQLLGPGLADTFPPLRSLDSLPNNLPRQLTPLIGRDSVLAEIEELVRARPLVSLVGTGGVGKTRLALQTGADLLDGSADGVWFVELAALADPAMVVNAVASTFGLREQGARPLLDVLVQYLKPRSLVLIFDNCEHLIEEVARVVEAVLRDAPNVRVLATTREPLRVAGERVYRVPSLAIPEAESVTAAEATSYGAVALFVERATASDAKFALSDGNAPFVAEICRRLDGIALAIELAAARVKVLPPRRLLQKLDERFRLLTGGSRTSLPRQQTMRALIDWSYDLLSERERLLFRRLGIFANGWTLEAAEAVCAGDELDAVDVIDFTASLVEKSLVAVDAAENARYRLLESTRAFALEKLEDSGEREMLARRFAEWAAGLADRVHEVRWLTTPSAEWRRYIEPEADNARSAFDWAFSRDEFALAAAILVGFSSIHRRLVGTTDLAEKLTAVLQRLDETAEPKLASLAWTALSRTTVGSRRIEAAERAVEIGERCSDAALTTRSLSELAFGLTQAGRIEEAQAIVERAMQCSEQNDLTRSSIHGSILNSAATIAHDHGRPEEARQLYAEALALTAALDDEESAIGIRLNMAELEFSMGNPERALELARAVEEEHRGPRMRRLVMFALQNGAAYRLALGDTSGARSAAQDALRLARGASPDSVVFTIQNLAAVAAQNGDPRRAARLRGFVDRWYRSEGYEREPTEARTYEILMAALSEQLDDSEIEALAIEGALLSEDRAVAEALAV
jgi:predicted ATPase/class 3 adenylate cyclase